MTEYVILRRPIEPGVGAGSEWWPIGTATARSAKAAIRERIDGTQQSSENYGDGEYVAVPARSWQPVSVRAETRTQLKFS